MQVLGILEGLAFGMLFMSSAAAIVIYFVVPIAWSILFDVVSALLTHRRGILVGYGLKHQGAYGNLPYVGRLADET